LVSTLLHAGTRVSRWRWLLPTLVVIALCSTAGVWQYQRGVYKERWLAEFADALTQPPQKLEVALAVSSAFARPVAGSLRRVAPAPWLLQDNVRRGAQVGVRAYAVYTAGESAALLVDFGWLPLAADRALPALAAPPDELDARGLVAPVPGQGLRLASNPWPATPDDTVLLAYLDLAEIEAALNRQLYPGVLRLDPALPVGFARDLDALPNTLPPEKHYGYALQWFGFAVTAGLIYLIFLVRSLRR